MRLIKDILIYTLGMAIVAIFAACVLFVMWIKEKFKYCENCKVK